jgi:hypothetical protein
MSHGIFIFPKEISSFSLGKMKIPWEISVPKLALREWFFTENLPTNLHAWSINYIYDLVY